MDNQQIANTFQEIGDLLEIDGANRFRVLAYQNASENIRGMGREIKDIWLENPKELENLPGIGPDLRLKIEEMLVTGVCQFHLNLIKKYGRGLLDILEVRSIGPKKAALFYRKLGVDNLDKLKAAALAHKLSELPRMGEKSEAEILLAIEEHAKYSHRMLLSEALPLAEKIVQWLKKSKEVARVEYAGSLRRRKETVGDLDILAAPKPGSDPQKIIDHFSHFPLIKNIIANGPTKSSAILENGAQTDLRVIELKSFGAALHYFTGSKDHNVEIRTYAQKAGKKINEYGIFDLTERDPEGRPIEKFIVGDTEEHFYKAVGLQFIPPTLRETRGEFLAAINNELPRLVEITDLKGDLNVNSSYSDGSSGIRDLMKATQRKSFAYLAIADTLHSEEFPTQFHETDLEKQLNEIDRLSKAPRSGKSPSPSAKTVVPLILKSVKLSINTDGTVDLPHPRILKRLDFITIKINHNFNLPEPRQTTRVLKALSMHPKIKMLSCPNGRILNERVAIAINMGKIIAHVIKHRQILEINSQPNRLDLIDGQVKLVVEKSAQSPDALPLLSINSDARAIPELDNLQYGIWTAQRGWAEKKVILNAQPLNKILAWLKTGL